jgi:hypothetical protein
MKSIFLIIVSLALGLIVSSAVLAHEEPAKTLKEKKEKEEKALFYLERNVASYTVWRHELSENIPDMIQKEKFLMTRLNELGHIAEMLIYKNTDTLDYRVAFTYDDQGNMIGDTDYNPDGSINENIDYSYDSFGRVIEQMNYSANDTFDSKFTYVIDDKSQSLIFTKFKPIDTIEYLIIYKYDGPVDQGNNTEIIKQTPDGELIMRVENIFDESNLRTQKRIFGPNNELMYYFEYKYFENTDRFSEIVKKSPENQILSKTVYTLNEFDLMKDVTIWDAEGKITSYSSYSYEFNP